MLSRYFFKKIGEETVKIVEDGYYNHIYAGKVSIEQEVKACVDGTKLYMPNDFKLPEVNLDKIVTKFEVTGETTLEAAERLHNQNPLCLNFASATSPGGGFLRGAIAQEETIARSSALYASLISKEGYYKHNIESEDKLYTDCMIYSPDVPIFRRDNGEFLPNPYFCSVITSPAVNRSNTEGVDETFIFAAMIKRIFKILSVAIEKKHDSLILGAWGCGVFGNNPKEVAMMFHLVLNNPRFINHFKNITFAVYDVSREMKNIGPFLELFS